MSGYFGSKAMDSYAEAFVLCFCLAVVGVAATLIGMGWLAYYLFNHVSVTLH